ncbi:hypothetical protein GCM10023347_03970 [Streptomyces chumphonensis]|uniref:Uncharacterized protein n=1 Tax=Streptomyces chumphonensis TaxID=1214925 RepID=A0A927F3F2_9ACTN|nr:hypothetical protein [Streptomyces chumphonensis]MBD3934280.1 hypothetical protein [Streptomyces chumphonensis]
MVEVETFLRDEDGRFVTAAACRMPPPDTDYVEGAVRLSVGGTEILGTEEWDYVDQLWCYMADMLTCLHSSGYAETYFPDQPIKLSFRRVGSRVVVSAEVGRDTRTSDAPSAALDAALRSGGRAFFDRMADLVPGNSYTEARRALES